MIFERSTITYLLEEIIEKNRTSYVLKSFQETLIFNYKLFTRIILIIIIIKINLYLPLLLNDSLKFRV